MIIPVTVESENRVRLKATEGFNAALTIKWAVDSWQMKSPRNRTFMLRGFLAVHPHPTLSYADWYRAFAKLLSGEVPVEVDGEDVIFSF